MAPDQPQLKAAAARSAVMFGLLLLLPLLAWTYASGRAALGSLVGNMVFTLATVRLTTLTLALCLPLALPWFARRQSWSDTLCGPLLVALIPLPLLLVLWLSGDLSPQALLLPLAAVALVMAVLAAALRLLTAAIVNPPLLAAADAAITVAVAGAAWALRDIWLAWLGL